MTLSREDKYAELREGNPTLPQAPHPCEQEPNAYYLLPGPMRSLRIIWPDGRRKLLGYVHLLPVDFSLGVEVNQLTLCYTYCKVELRGYGLEKLLEPIAEQRLREITVTEPRYAVLYQDGTPLVIQAQINSEKASLLLSGPIDERHSR